MVGKPYKYWAFISYSHRDQAWAEWLHRALESYRVPRRLVGRETPVGIIPRRLFPIFRDAEELPSSPNLSGVIDEALQQSRYLIIIASPYAAVSRWVDEEIQRFRALGRADRILCLIVDGEPHAHLLPDKGLLECFPPSLREAGGAEPVGADVRSQKDSKAAAKLRLIAGLLNVGLDELRRRERRRRRLRVATWGLAAACAVFVLLGFWQVQQAAKQDALASQALHAHIQTLYEKGRQELQARNEARAAVYLNEAYRLGLNTPALRFMLGRAMRVVDAEKFRIDAGAPLESVSFSEDTKRLITVDTAHRASIWDVATRQKLLAFSVPEAARAFIGFSRDGSKLLVHVKDAEKPRLQIVDSLNGASLAELGIARNSYSSQTQFDPSGRYLAFVEADGHAAVYDFEAGNVVRRLQSNCVLAGYSRDGRWLITGDGLGTTRVYDAASGHLLRSLDALGAPIVYVDTSPDGSLLAAGALNGRFRLWETENGRTRISAAHATTYVGHVFNSIDGSRLLTASHDSARIWDTRSGALLNSIKFTSNDQRIHISEDGRRLINTGDARLNVIDTETGVDLFSLDAHFGGVADIDFSSDDRLLATAGRDGVVAVWELPQLPRTSFRHGLGLEDAADPDATADVISGYSPTGDLGFSGGADGRVEWWDSHTLQPMQQVSTGLGVVTAGAFSADGKQLAIGSLDGLKLWDAGSGSLAGSLPSFGKVIRAIRFSADGQLLAVIQRKRQQAREVQLWQLPSATALKTLPLDRYAAQAFSPTGPGYAVASQGTVNLWDVAKNSILWSVHLGSKGTSDVVNALSFNADGSRLLTISDDGMIDVLDAANGYVLMHARDANSLSVVTAMFSPDSSHVLLSDDNRCAFLLRLQDLVSNRLCAHGNKLSSAGYRSDGALIFTAGLDGLVKIWDANGSLLDSVGFHGGAITRRTTAFSSDGDYLLTGADDGTARVWDTSPERRSAAEVAASLQCRVPWYVDGDDLIAIHVDASRCGDP